VWHPRCRNRDRRELRVELPSHRSAFRAISCLAVRLRTGRRLLAWKWASPPQDAACDTRLEPQHLQGRNQAVRDRTSSSTRGFPAYGHLPCGVSVMSMCRSAIDRHSVSLKISFEVSTVVALRVAARSSPRAARNPRKKRRAAEVRSVDRRSRQEKSDWFARAQVRDGRRRSLRTIRWAVDRT